MRFSTSSLIALASLASAQTQTACNPLSQSCPADKALGKTVNIDFTAGKSSEFTADGSNFSYNSNGAQLTMTEAANSPTFISGWYIMFGRYDVVMQSAPGTGICSSIVLQSDDLDEIDWEMLGYQPTQGQTNYFGKGITGDYNRGLTVSVPGSTSQFNTYSVDWNAERIIWEVNGVAVRTLNYGDAEAGQYPQSPMQFKMGAWVPGSSASPPGTVSWAGGMADFSKGPFTMQVKSVKVQDYSTGTQYEYQGNAGTWQSIKAVGGSVGSQGTSSGGAPNPGSSNQKPGSSSSVVSVPATFTTIPAGTHKSSSDYSTPSTFPWVSTGSTQITTTSSASSTVSPSVTTGSDSTSATPVPQSSADVGNNSPGSVAPSFSLLVSTVAFLAVSGFCGTWFL